ncbi:MAG: hypothetical protein HQ522_20450 [Bacteroidetes bacterium]|nr:hypothetical protein [Bacteroidota bacterium]
MKKIFVSTIMVLFCSSLVFASEVEGKWKGSIDTDNGPWEFSVVYKVSDEKISGEFFTEYGNLEFGEGKISGKEFEYSFDIEGVKHTHKGKLINDKEILIKYSNENGETGEFTFKKSTN